MVDYSVFILTLLPFALSPGASFTLAISNVAQVGLRGCVSVIIGTTGGIVFYSLLVGFGVLELITRYPIMFTLISVLGSLFLFWIGCKLLHAGWVALKHKTALRTQVATTKDALLLSVFNAKGAMLYLTVFPVFAGSSLVKLTTLASIHFAVMASWTLLASFLFLHAAKWFQLDKLRIVVNVVGGLCLLVMALRMAAGIDL
ncbi:MAG: hypothetical protein GJ680_12280 [Alteromonadaceae bacterium]|nr:hypothetical protein [Alteromonadaceae bacterium]